MQSHKLLLHIWNTATAVESEGKLTLVSGGREEVTTSAGGVVYQIVLRRGMVSGDWPRRTVRVKVSTVYVVSLTAATVTHITN